MLGSASAVRIANKNQINPSNPTGLEPAPKDFYYEVPHQLKKSLNWENTHDEDDWANKYNPNKTPNPFGHNFAEIDPVNPTGLEPQPKDW